jgi:hypothetical protein
MVNTNTEEHYSRAYILNLDENKETLDVVDPNKGNTWKNIFNSIFEVNPNGVDIISNYRPTLLKGLLHNNSYTLYVETVTINKKDKATFLVCDLKKKDEIVIGWCSNKLFSKEKDLLEQHFFNWLNNKVLEDEDLSDIIIEGVTTILETIEKCK